MQYGGRATMQDLHFRNQQLVSSSDNSPQSPLMGEVSSFFDVFFNVTLPGTSSPIPLQGTGHGTWRFRESPTLPSPGSTRVFDTEMLSLTLTGGGGGGGGALMIRESPTLASMGKTMIDGPDQGGLYRIDSFFNVFTELSIDGGQTWMPGDGALRMSGSNVPEPSALVAWSLLGASGIGVRWWRRRKQAE